MASKQTPRQAYLAAGELWTAAIGLQRRVELWETQLYDLAKAKHPRAGWWWGMRSFAGWTEARCYVCGDRMASWARHGGITTGAQVRIARHGAGHYRGRGAAEQG